MSNPVGVCLLSGGLDSATVAAMAIRDGFDLAALTVNYGQRHAVELNAAKRIALSLGIDNHVILQLDLRAFGGSALTADLEVPKGGSRGIPLTYVPARNTVFLSLALAWAEALGSTEIFIGVNAVDYSGYPDCRPEFIEAFEGLARVATKSGVEGRFTTIHAPLIHRSKADIVRLAVDLDVDLSLTTSCYDPGSSGRPCGECDACLLRASGFAEAGMRDPAAV